MLFHTIKKNLFSPGFCKIPPKPQGARILACSDFPGLLIKNNRAAESLYQGHFQPAKRRIQAGQGFAGNIQLFISLQTTYLFFCTLNSQPASPCGMQ